MEPELLVAIGVEVVNGSFLDGPVRALDLAVGSRMLGLGQAVVDVILGTSELEGVTPEGMSVRHGFLDRGDG